MIGTIMTVEIAESRMAEIFALMASKTSTFLDLQELTKLSRYLELQKKDESSGEIINLKAKRDKLESGKMALIEEMNKETKEIKDRFYGLLDGSEENTINFYLEEIGQLQADLKKYGIGTKSVGQVNTGVKRSYTTSPKTKITESENGLVWRYKRGTLGDIIVEVSAKKTESKAVVSKRLVTAIEAEFNDQGTTWPFSTAAKYGKSLEQKLDALGYAPNKA